VSAPALLGRRMAAEAVGTFFLVLMGPGAIVVNALTGGALTPLGIALAFGLVILIMVASLGHLSGAHLNPAVTLAFWSSGHFPAADVVAYIVAQCAGAAGASLLTRAALGPAGHVGATLPTVSSGVAFGVEGTLSLMLMLVIMAAATDERVTEGSAAVVVGATVGLCALVGGPLTGASMNPARSLGPALAGGGWDRHWIYWTAPVLGMLAGAHAYEWLRRAQRPERDLRGERLGVAGRLASEPPSDLLEVEVDAT
jgi:MIP family channel proteins